MSTDKRMAIKPALNQFNGGEISPYLEGRYDWDKYNYSAKSCKNFIPTVEGYLRRRGGTHFVKSGVETKSITVAWGIFFPDSQPLPVKLIVNDEEVDLGTQYFVPFTKRLVFSEGDEVTYSVIADGCVPVSATFIAEGDNDTYLKTIEVHLISLEDAVTLTINPDPAGSVVRINNIIAKTLTVEKGTTAVYSVTYANETVSSYEVMTEDKTVDVAVQYTIFDSNKSQVKNIYVSAAYYSVAVVGAGGGSGGGAYGSGHSKAGKGGGGGAAFVGVVRLSGQLRLIIGSKGLGGESRSKEGYGGTDGGLSSINDLIVANGGKGGQATWLSAGAGGVLQINNDIVQSYTIKSNGYDGANTIGGYSLYNGHGKGGDGVSKQNGSSGANGYIQIKYYGGL